MAVARPSNDDRIRDVRSAPRTDNLETTPMQHAKTLSISNVRELIPATSGAIAATTRETIATTRPIARVGLSLLLLAALLPCLAGCAMLGAAASAVPVYTDAAYKGLAHQTTAVMVWADRGTNVDWPTVQLDLGTAIQAQLIGQMKDSDDLKDVRFPNSAASVVRFQHDHPDIEGQPVVMIASRLGVQRLIYVEVETFGTRAVGSASAMELYRGAASASVKVVEAATTPAAAAPGARASAPPAAANGAAKVAYQEAGISVVYPKKAPPEGVPGLEDEKIYRGTVAMLAAEIANRFYRHETPDDH